MFWPSRSSRCSTSRSVSRSVKALPETIRPKRNGLALGLFTRSGITRISIRRCASLRNGRQFDSGGALHRTAQGVIAGQELAPVDARIPRAEVRQGKTIAGGLGAGFAAAHLTQVPVIELVAVEEAQHFAPGAKPDGLAEPSKTEPLARAASSSVVDLLVPGGERLRHLQLDQAVVVPAKGGQVRGLPVAQRPGADRVAWRRRQVRQPAAERLGVDRRGPRSNRDGIPGAAKRGGGPAISINNRPQGATGRTPATPF